MSDANRTRVVTLAATVVALASLVRGLVPALAGGDRTRDLLFARDCADLGRCVTRAAAMSVPGYWQGGLWTAVLALARRAHSSFHSVQVLVLLCAVLSIALFTRVVARALGPLAALASPCALCALLVPCADVARAWNPSLLPLPCVLATLSLVSLVRTARTRHALACAIATGIAASLHPVGLLLGPALLAAIVLGASRPRIALPAALVALAFPLVATSRAALVADARTASLDHAPGVLLLACTVLSLAMLALARPRFARLSATARAVLVLAVTPVVTLVAFAWLVFRAHGAPALYYAHPAFASLALLVAFAAARMRWIAFVPSACVLAWSVLADRTSAADVSQWRIDDAPLVAPRVLADGTQWDQVRFSIEGPSCGAASEMLAAVAPAPSGDVSTVLPARTWRMVRLDASDSALVRAAGFATVALGHDAIAALSPFTSVLERDGARACFTGGDGLQGCVPVLGDPGEHVAPRLHLFARRDYPEAYVYQHAGTYDVAFEYPVKPREAPVRIDLVGEGHHACGWHFVRVDGIACNDSLPASSVTLGAGDGGRVVVSRRVDPVHCPNEPDTRTPPCFFESRADEGELRARVLR